LKSEIKEQFPELHREMFVKEKSLTLPVDEISSPDELDEKSVEGTSLNEVGEVSLSRISDPLDRYSPSVDDFLARADTDEDALAIINYLRRKNEISVEKAGELTEIIQQRGVRSLGPKRTPGHYNRFTREERSKKQMKRRVNKKE